MTGIQTFAMNKCKQTILLTQKDISTRLLGPAYIESISEYLAAKHNITPELTNKSFKNIRMTTKIIALQNTQFKLLHNIYPTQKHLYNWKIKDNPYCSHCNVVEDLKHAIYECEMAKSTISNLESLISRVFGIDFKLTFKDILIGTACKKDLYLELKEKLLIDEILIMLKRSMILQREDKRVITAQELINILKNHYKLYKANKWKNSAWHTILNVIEEINLL